MKRNRSENFMQGVMALMVSQITIKVLGMIYSLYLTNKTGFGDKGNAICFSAYQIYIIFLTISSIGIPNSISKIVAEELAIGNIKGTKRILKVAIVIFGMVGFICSVILYFSAEYIAKHFLQIKEAEFILKLLAPSIFWITITSVLRGYFNAKRKIKISARVQTIEQVFKTIITIILVEFIARITNSNTELMAITSSLSIVLASVISFIYILICFIKNEKEERTEYVLSTYKYNMTINEILKKIMYIAIPVALSSFLMSLSKNIDSFTIMRILKENLGEEIAKERYGILSSKVELLTMFPTALNGSIALALIPEISRISTLKDKKKMNKNVNFSLLLTLFMCIPIMFLMSRYSNEIIDLLYPNANKGGELLALSAFSIVCLCLIQTTNGILQGIGKIDVYIKSTIIGLIIKFVLNMILIPIHGIYEKGAVIATIVSDLVISILLIKKMCEILNVNIVIRKKTIKILISTFLSIIIIEKIKIQFIIKVILNIIMYIVLIFVLKVFDEDEIKTFPNGEKIYVFMRKIKIYKNFKKTRNT